MSRSYFSGAIGTSGLVENLRKLWIFAIGDVFPKLHVHGGAKTRRGTGAAGDYLSAQRNANPSLRKDRY
jgi:hypothetical protein